MKNNLDSLKYIVTYRNGTDEFKRISFDNYDRAYDYFCEKNGDYGSAKLFIEKMITTEIRIK